MIAAQVRDRAMVNLRHVAIAAQAVIHAALRMVLQCGQRYRGIQVVKHSQGTRQRQHLIIDPHTIREIAAGHDHIGDRRFRKCRPANFFPVGIQDQLAVIATREITAASVVVHVFFVKREFMPQLVQRAQDCSVRCGVAVAPRRRESQAEYRNLQCPTIPGPRQKHTRWELMDGASLPLRFCPASYGRGNVLTNRWRN